ncbi:MAG: hypothetical protein HC862_19730 [Scytonema sp. RU_4_4]|nr:hypothetical protein [Scytonema sp. RU_4_4]
MPNSFAASIPKQDASMQEDGVQVNDGLLSPGGIRPCRPHGASAPAHRQNGRRRGGLSLPQRPAPRGGRGNRRECRWQEQCWGAGVPPWGHHQLRWGHGDIPRPQNSRI